MDEFCGNCKFWKCHQPDGDEPLDGMCRYNPPAQFVTPGNELNAYWPITRLLDWCGRWVLDVTKPPKARNV